MKKKPYGGINDIPKYLLEQYGENGRMIRQGPPVAMNTTSMESISGRRTRNCSVVAVARVLDYYRRRYKIVSIPEDIRHIYKAVEEIAKSYGYTDKIGTLPFFISGITREAFAMYGVKAKCRGIYI